MSLATRAAVLLAALAVAVPAAFAGGLYSLRYRVDPSGARFAFDVEVVHEGSGQTVLRSTLRTRPGEWGEVATGHAGRTVRVRTMGETNGYAELVLEVLEQGKVVQREVYRYTERAAGPPTRYHGDPISLHLRDADLKDVLLAFAEIGHTNIAVDPGVKGSVTLDLADVPWDQALDLILQQHGLVKRVEGKAMFISPMR